MVICCPLRFLELPSNSGPILRISSSRKLKVTWQIIVKFHRGSAEIIPTENITSTARHRKTGRFLQLVVKSCPEHQRHPSTEHQWRGWVRDVCTEPRVYKQTPTHTEEESHHPYQITATMTWLNHWQLKEIIEADTSSLIQKCASRYITLMPLPEKNPYSHRCN